MSEPQQPIIATGASVEVEALREGFNRGFSDYPYNLQLDATAMPIYLASASIAVEDCAVLMAEEQGRLHGVGASLLAVRGEEGWCGGLGVAPHYRGHGWGRRLMEQFKRRAVERGVRRARLEARVENHHALDVYRRVGFVEQRELLLWERDPRQGALPLPYERLEETDPARILREFYCWHEQPLAWQRSASSLLSHVAQFDCIGLTIPAKDGAPVAYVVAELMPRSRPRGELSTRVQILDIAVDPSADLLDAGRPLVQALQLRYVDKTLAITNEPEDSCLNRIFASFGFRVFDRQYEMALNL